MRKYISVLFCVFIISQNLFAENAFIKSFTKNTISETIQGDEGEIGLDTITPENKKPFELSQIIVTGYGKPTPIDSSLYNVRVIDKQKILNSGATSLGELFLTEPNINVSTDPYLGTQLEMFGMGGRNVKVMIDGVPIIGRLNGQIDLSQIPINNIDHIEIIEGPMSVVYGNNALAGTINIITHSNKNFATEVRTTAKIEYPYRYNLGAAISQKIEKSIFSLSGNYSDFKGVDFDKTTRSMEWKPQRRYNIGGDYQFNFKDWVLKAKADISNSRTHVKGDIQYYRALDSYFYTNRYTGALSLNGGWNKNNHLSVLLSHSYYKRLSQDASKDLTTLKEEKQAKKVSQIEKNDLLRAIWTYTPNKIALNIESGIDFNLSAMEGKRIKDDKQNLNDYAGFINVRYTPFKSFSIQPGLRVAYNTGYKAPILYSFNTKWDILKNLSWRASVAKGFRAPTVKELYYIFVDSNHEIYGNSNLKAEKSNSYNTSIDYKYKWNNKSFNLNAKLYYNDVYNLITLINKPNSTGYQYNNINHYKTRGGSLGATFYYKNILQLNASSIFTGRYNNLKVKRDYNTSVDWLLGVKFKELRTKIQLDVDAKFYGKENYFYYDSQDNIKEGNIDDYKILNVSLSRNFLKNRLRITVGAKNLLNVKEIYLSGNVQKTAHSSGSGIPIAYGTSYFIKAMFNITK